jgi:hypothetical protein
VEWVSRFAEREEKDSLFLSHHYYPLNAKEKKHDVQYASIPNLLSEKYMSGYVDLIRPFVKAGHSFRLTETNSASHGGAKGVSDVFASTLWGIDFLFTSLKEGVASVHFHTGGKTSVYSPIEALTEGEPQPKPLYYAMLFVDAAAKGNLVDAFTLNKETSLKAYATENESGLRVTLLNKDSTHDYDVELQAPNHHKQATIRRLTASSLKAHDGITFSAPSPIQLDESTIQITVPHSSAALVELR